VIRFTNQGGSVLSWRLKEFHDSRKAPVELVPEFARASASSARPLQWDLDDQELRLSFRYWEGAVTATGSSRGAPLTGRGYLELTGY